MNDNFRWILDKVKSAVDNDSTWVCFIQDLPEPRRVNTLAEYMTMFGIPVVYTRSSLYLSYKEPKIGINIYGRKTKVWAETNAHYVCGSGVRKYRRSKDYLTF